MHRKLGLFFASSALAGMAACAQLPHNNVLLFGTDTKVALDISSSATSGGAPQLTIGYRRAEAVWMPLVANRWVCNDQENENCTVETAEKDGEVKVLQAKDIKDSKGVDAYSVFASFGAKFSGEAGPAAEGVSASGGLAQFFATGIAAQRVADSGQLNDILKVSNAAEANAQATKAIAVSDADRARIASEQKDLALTNNQRASKVLLACGGGPQGDKTKWTAGVNAVPGLGEDDKRELMLASVNNSAIKLLRTDPVMLKAFEDNLSTACPV